MLDEPKTRNQPSAMDTVRLIIPLVLLGFLIALCSLLILTWPGRLNSDGTLLMTSHLGRLTDELVNGAPVARILVDISIYVLMIASFGLMLVAWARRSRAMLIGLMGIGLLGIAYASGTSLYAGPLVSICGFSLMLFGSLVAWAALPDDSLDEPSEAGTSGEINKEMFAPADQDQSPIDGTNMGKEDYGSHSAA